MGTYRWQSWGSLPQLDEGIGTENPFLGLVFCSGAFALRRPPATISGLDPLFSIES